MIRFQSFYNSFIAKIIRKSLKIFGLVNFRPAFPKEKQNFFINSSPVVILCRASIWTEQKPLSHKCIWSEESYYKGVSFSYQLELTLISTIFHLASTRLPQVFSVKSNNIWIYMYSIAVKTFRTWGGLVTLWMQGRSCFKAMKAMEWCLPCQKAGFSRVRLWYLVRESLTSS